MADFMYSPKWGDINQVRLKFGLSDDTIAQLTREDASFRRVNGDAVEYDLDKILNHPKVQAFREKQRSGQATGISYENIIKDVVPRVVLPELTEDQRLYLKTIFDYFHVEGKWPTFLWVENTLLRAHPEKRPNFDLAEICKDLPDNFVSKFSFNNQYKDEARFMVPVLYYFPEAKEEIKAFMKVIGFCVDKMNTSEEESPVLLSQDLTEQLHMDPLTVQKIGSLLPAEPCITAGGSSNTIEGWWRWGLQRGRYGVRRLEGVTTFEQYLEKRAELTRTFLGNAPVQTVHYEPEIALPIPNMRPGGTQYQIVHGDQYNISGNAGEVKVKSPSIDIAPEREASHVAATNDHQDNTAKKNTHRSPWISGSFYLVVFVVIVIMLSVIARILPVYILPIVIIGGLLSLAVVGAFQLRQDDRLSEENFFKLMLLSFKYLPWLWGNTKNRNP